MLAVFAVPAGPALAAASFNDHPNDRDTLRVKNSPTGTVSTSGWSSSASASPGDTISFAIYYHNTSSEDAQNVRLRMSPQSTGVRGTHSFTATVSADNAASVSGSVEVFTSPETSLSFIPGSVEWYPNQTQSNPTALPSGQSGSELFGSGLNIGTIIGATSNNDFSAQGSVVFNFRVEDNQQNNPPADNTNPPFISFFASPSGVQDPGDTTVLRWTTDNAVSCSAFSSPSHQNWNGSVGVSGSRVVSVDERTTFTLTCRNNHGVSTTRSTTVEVDDFDGFGDPSATTNPATGISSTSAQLNAVVFPNGSHTRAHFQWGPTASLGFVTNDHTIGSSGSRSISRIITGLSPNTTYFYRVVARNNNGFTRGQVLSFRTNSAGAVTPPADTSVSVVTNVPVVLGATTARLNGLAFPNGNFVTGSFEWGRTQNLNNTTQTQSLGTASVEAFSQTLTGLSPNTTYFVRAVAEGGSSGTVRGDILSFRTNSLVSTPPPTTSEPTTQPRRSASISKEIENLDNPNGTDESIEAERGDAVRFFIVVQNTGNTTLEDVEIHDRIPTYVEFANSEALFRSGDEREVVWILGDMEPGEIENVELDVVVTEDAPNTVIENIARVEAENGITQNSNTVRIRVTDNIGVRGAAAAVFGEGFFPDTLLGWLVLVAIILGLLLLFRFLAIEMEARRNKRISETPEQPKSKS